MIDVCLILEGTYPFVSGGVSTWVHQLINEMKDLRFSILYISPFPDPKREFKYKVPSHVLDIKDVYLHQYAMEGPLSPRTKRVQDLAKLETIHEKIINHEWDQFKELATLFQSPLKRPTIRDIFDSHESWEILSSFYVKYGEGVSFLDFFWTWRSIYLPLYNILTTKIPQARLYHTVSTGYAGLLACLCKLDQNKKMLLTEHGIYTNERFLEISQASWIFSPTQGRFKIEKELPFFKRMWLGLFQTFGSLTYHQADHILTLYEGNRTRQILDGADPEKISIIPNGVNVQEFSQIHHKGLNPKKPIIGFIGRVVSIKDVKTFLHAAKIVLATLPDAQFLILGPMDEEPEYKGECLSLAVTLEFGDRLQFLGKVNVQEYYAQLDLVVLTSLSEAQPYVILEANAVGIPVVASDVGACRELVEGRTSDDHALGASGLITQVSNPEDTALAMLKILGDPELWNKMSLAGRTRVQRYYDQNDLLSQYLNLYEKNLR